MKKFFIGPKQTAIKNTNFFDASITLIGTGKNNNISFYNDIPFEFWNDDNVSKEIEIYNKALNNLPKDEKIEIMAYNPIVFSECLLPENVKAICMNDKKLLKILDDKIKTREFFKDIVPMLQYWTIRGKDFEYSKLSKEISKELIIQAPLGSGGAKTYYCNEENYSEIKKFLVPNQKYSISAYKKDNMSFTIYGMIGKKQIEIMPPAQQVFEIINNVEWLDSKYDIELSDKIAKKLIDYTMKICEKIQKMNYRGIFNLDFIFTNRRIVFN